MTLEEVYEWLEKNISDKQFYYFGKPCHAVEIQVNEVEQIFVFFNTINDNGEIYGDKVSFSALKHGIENKLDIFDKDFNPYEF